jgi:hypothetical protein
MPLRSARLRRQVVTQGKHHYQNGCGRNQDFGGQTVLHSQTPRAE